jgi:hypothetical protein
MYAIKIFRTFRRHTQVIHLILNATVILPLLLSANGFHLVGPIA